MSRQVTRILLLAIIGLMIGDAGRRWSQDSPQPGIELTQEPSHKVADADKKSHTPWTRPSDSELQLAASQGEMVLSQLLSVAKQDDDGWPEMVKVFAALPAKNPPAEVGLFVSLLYWSRQDAKSVLNTILGWPDIHLKPAAVHGAFFGAQTLTEAEMSNFLEKARLVKCIVPAVMGASEVRPQLVVKYLKSHENDFVAAESIHDEYFFARVHIHSRRRFDRLLEIAFSGWAKIDPDTAYAAAKAHPAWARGISNSIGEVLSHRYPEKMIHLRERYNFIESVFSRFSGEDWLSRIPATQALDFVKANPSLRNAAEPLLAEWAKSDFAAAAAWAKNASPALKGSAERGLLAGGTTEELLAYAETLVSRRKRIEFQESVLAKMVTTDPIQTLQRLDLLPPRNRQNFVTRYLKSLLQNDSNALVSYLGSHPEIKLAVHPSDFDNLTSWPTDVAERLLNLLPQSPEVAKKMIEIKSELILKGELSAPETYEKLVALHTDEASAATAFVSKWWQTSEPTKFSEIQQWLEARPAAVQQAVLSKLAHRLEEIGMSSPDGLFPRLAAEFSHVETQKVGNYQSSMRSLSLRLAQKKSPEELVRWTESLPVNSVTEVAKSATAEAWLKSDPLAASAWVWTWPEGKQKEQAAASIVLNTVVDDPEAAEKWLGVIQDPEQRDHCISQVVQKFIPINPAQARSWLEQIRDPKLRGSLEGGFR